MGEVAEVPANHLSIEFRRCFSVTFPCMLTPPLCFSGKFSPTPSLPWLDLGRSWEGALKKMALFWPRLESSIKRLFGAG